MWSPFTAIDRLTSNVIVSVRDVQCNIQCNFVHTHDTCPLALTLARRSPVTGYLITYASVMLINEALCIVAAPCCNYVVNDVADYHSRKT